MCLILKAHYYISAGPGQLNRSCCVHIDHTNTLFICDHDNKCVCIVSPQGQHLEDYNLSKLNPWGVVVISPGQFMITCQSGCKKSDVLPVLTCVSTPRYISSLEM